MNRDETQLPLPLSVSNRPRGCTLQGSLASPAGRTKIAHRLIGGDERGGEASPPRDERTLPSLTGLVPLRRPCPPMNRWAILFRPAGLAQMRVRCSPRGPHSRKSGLARWPQRIALALPLLAFGFATDPAVAADWPAKAERDAAAKGLDLGESAPDWLVQSETYAFGSGTNAWEALAASKVAFVTHCPANREYFQRLHALGIRAFPYVTFYQGFATTTYEGLNLKDHPEFIEIDAEGNLKRTGFWESEDAKNMYTTCPAVPQYQDAMVAWVRRIMELGADGVFVDNLSSRVPCFGAKFGKHKHVAEDPNHAFAIMLKRVREVVKQYKPDGAVLGNSADPTTLPHEFWQHLDAEMLESYICTWVSKDRWFDWSQHWHQKGVQLEPFIKAGKQVQALSYLGHTSYGVREDAFFCYATARLAGFVWNGGLPLTDPDTAVLYRIRLGPPLAAERAEKG